MSRFATAYLPRIARDLVELTGLPATLRLVEAWGGRTIDVAHGKRARGKVANQELAGIVGKIAAAAIVRRYAGTPLAVPNCKHAIRAMRDAELQARFDTLTKAKGGLSARKAVTQMVGEYNLVESSIWRALKRPAGEAAVTAAIADDKQLAMF